MQEKNRVSQMKGDRQRSPGQTLKTLPTELLGQAAEEARRRVTRLKEEFSRLQATLAAAEQEQHLLDKLLAVRGAGGPSEPASSSGHPGAQPATAGPNAGSGHALLAEAIGIMESAGRPLHISELMRLLTERKVPIPGSGNQANVISYLRRDRRIVRPSRGMYGLSTWGLQEMPRPKRKRRPRGRARPSTRT